MTSPSKALEARAFSLLEAHLQARFPGAVLENHCNKGGGHSHVIGDAIMRYQGRAYDIEIKASTKEPVGNIRLTHQTVTKASGQDVIVALISWLGTESPTFEFFRLTDVVADLKVEPHFFVMKKHVKAKVQPLDSILTLPAAKLDIETQLDRTVRSYMNKRVHKTVLPEAQAQAMIDDADQAEQDAADGSVETDALAIADVDAQSPAPPWASPDHALWSPYGSDMDEAGEPYPPWLKYPNLPRTSSGWRQGEGETYAEEFYDWLDQQPPNVLKAYRAKYSAPEAWRNVWPREASE
jgi:hypothetical protein